jgi:hypothetical protein
MDTTRISSLTAAAPRDFVTVTLAGARGPSMFPRRWDRRHDLKSLAADERPAEQRAQR